jgi:hypothetical protein
MSTRGSNAKPIKTTSSTKQVRLTEEERAYLFNVVNNKAISEDDQFNPLVINLLRKLQR